MQMYRLLHLMAASLPPLPDRFPLFAHVATHESTTVSFQADKVVKHIRDFPSFSMQHHTSFAEIQQAYKAAGAASAAAKASGAAPWLVYACDNPMLTRNKTFKVALHPVGYRAAPVNENVSDLSWCCKHDPLCLYSHCFVSVPVFLSSFNSLLIFSCVPLAPSSSVLCAWGLPWAVSSQPCPIPRCDAPTM